MLAVDQRSTLAHGACNPSPECQSAIRCIKDQQIVSITHGVCMGPCGLRYNVIAFLKMFLYLFK